MNPGQMIKHNEADGDRFWFCRFVGLLPEFVFGRTNFYLDHGQNIIPQNYPAGLYILDHVGDDQF